MVESDDGRPSRRQRSERTELSRVVSDGEIIFQSPIYLITKSQQEEDRTRLEVKSTTMQRKQPQLHPRLLNEGCQGRRRTFFSRLPLPYDSKFYCPHPQAPCLGRQNPRLVCSHASEPGTLTVSARRQRDWSAHAREAPRPATG